MIPRRITLDGFLCYRERQTIDLDGADLWAFAGRNGSGKSSVFDAITFAFFGEHRGGAVNAAALINHDSDRFVIELEFDLQGRSYRIQRSLRRDAAASERQLFRLELDADGAARWVAVPGTHRDKGFEQWVQDNLGLTHDTFTSSVLLLQGSADKLLSAKPKERFAVLAGVVDLVRFQNLHKVADRRRMAAEERLKALRDSLAGTPMVEASDVDQAARQAAEASVAREAAAAEERAIEDRRRHAVRWSELVQQRDELSARLRESQALLDNAATIERDLQRLRDLDAVLPALRDAERWRVEEEALAAAVAAHAAQCQALERKRSLVGALAAEVDARLADLRDEVRRDGDRQRAITTGLAQLGGPLERARTARRQRDAVRRLEVEASAFPPDVQAALDALERQLTERHEDKAALPLLARFAEDRDKLLEAQAQLPDAESRLADARAEAARLASDRDARTAAVDAAKVTAQAARDRATEARTRADHAAERQSQFDALGNAATCDRCGQPLEAEHRVHERRRRHTDADRLAALAAQAEQDYTATAAALHAAERELLDCRQRLETAEKRTVGASQQFDALERDVRAHGDQCRDRYLLLAEPYRLRVAPAPPSDWTTLRYPTEADLAQLRTHAGDIPEITAQRNEAKRQCEDWKRVDAQLAQARQALAELGDSTADVAELEAEEKTLEAEAESLEHCLASHANEIRLAEESRQQLANQANDLEAQRAALALEAQGDAVRAETLRDGRQRARAGLRDPWRAVFDAVSAEALERHEAEGRELRDSKVEARARALPDARAQCQEAQRILERVQAEIAAIPAAAQCRPSDFDDVLAHAAQQSKEAEERFIARSHEELRLRDALDRLQRLRQDVLEAERARQVAQTLATLLGRDGLQREVLREAEHGIVACANPILAELSGGELSLRLTGGDSGDPERVLQLETVERIGARTLFHPVAFLSGSQRFRVAVSLALAIGQLARGLGRRIESVIIDEGFGSLDRVGRQEMIAQLNALRGCMGRIILVSHQEEFSDAFTDGYLFERIDGATRVAPFHR